MATLHTVLTPAKARLVNAHFDYVEEVSQAVQRRVDHNIAQADEFGREMDSLADLCAALMANPFSGDASPQEFFCVLEASSSLADRIDTFGRIFERFVSDHASSMRTPTVPAIRQFIQWLPNETKRLAAQVSTQLERIRDGIEKASAEDRELAKEWAHADSDGWPND